MSDPAAGPSNHAASQVQPLLGYERLAVAGLIREDALCILGSGMGWQRLVAVFARLHHYQQAGALLVVGCLPWQKDVLCAELARHDSEVLLPADISAEVPAMERIELYKSRRCCFVTTRILVVDLLTHRLEPRQVAGLVIMNAHRVTDHSGEAFAVQMLRAGTSCNSLPGPSGAAAHTNNGNKGCYVRALSDQPQAFTSGFNKVERVMRALHVRKLHLWPRFQSDVAAAMELTPPEVVEWEQELTEPMLYTLAAIAEIVESFIKEHKRTNKIDCTFADALINEGPQPAAAGKPEQTRGGAPGHSGAGASGAAQAFTPAVRGLGLLHRAVDESIRRQLEPTWQTVGWRTRQIVKDLRTLRTLASYLTAYDAITFLAYLEGLRQSEGTQCVWLFHEAAHTIFNQARRRVYIYRQTPSKRQQQQQTKADAKTGAGRKRKPQKDEQSTLPPGTPYVEAVLEEPPKWGLLREVLEEVSGLKAALADARAHPDAPADADGGRLQEAAIDLTLCSSDDEKEKGGKGVGGEDVDMVKPGSEEEKQREEQRRQRRQRVRQQRARQEQQQQQQQGAGHGLQGAQQEHQQQGAEHYQQQGAGQGQQQQQTEVQGSAEDQDVDAPLSVMVVTREQHACRQLERVIEAGGRQVMQAAYEAYILRLHHQPTQSGHRSSSSNSKFSRGAKGGARGNRGTGGRGRSARDVWVAGTDAPTAVVAGSRGGWRGGRGGRKPRGIGGSVPITVNEHGEEEDDLVEMNEAAGFVSEAEKKALMQVILKDDRLRGTTLPAAATAVATGSEGGGVASAAVEDHGKRAKKGEGSEDLETYCGVGKGDLGARPAHMGAKGSSKGGRRGVKAQSRVGPATSEAVGPLSEALEDGQLQTGEAHDEGVEPCPLLRGVHFRSLEMHCEQDLWDLCPDVVVMYEPDLPFLRQVEVYAAERWLPRQNNDEDDMDASDAKQEPQHTKQQQPSNDQQGVQQEQQHAAQHNQQQQRQQSGDQQQQQQQQQEDAAGPSDQPQPQGCPKRLCPPPALPCLRVILLTYAGSTERGAFQSAVDREISVFSSLIEAKQHLVLPEVSPLAMGINKRLLPRGEAANSADAWLDIYQQNALTRIAGGMRSKTAAPAVGVVVDMREFMSSLPAVLYQQGFELSPVTLEVGDYVLSPTMAVERKAVPDLLQSLASGRLYSQAEALCKYYRTPILLIEFDGDKQWGLTHASELGLDIDSRSPGARLSLLLLHFPRLRLVWSRSLHATADMFGALKASGDEPDPAAAAAVGLPEGANAPGSAPAPLINTAALEVLKRMPGVTQAGARNLMATVGSLTEIAQLTLPQLQAAMAGDAERLRALLDGALEEEEEQEAQAAVPDQGGSRDGQQGPEKGVSGEAGEGQQQQQQQRQQQQQQQQQAGASISQKGGMAGGAAGRAKTLYEFLHAPCPLAG